MKSKILQIRKVFLLVLLLGLIFVLPNITHAATMVVSQGVQYGYGSGYNGSSWTNMTATLNTAFGGSENITEVTNFEDVNLTDYDAVWVDLRHQNDTLSANEISKLQAFLATGRKLVMIGENAAWPTWNGSMLSVVGGTFDGGASSGSYGVSYSHDLTASISSVYLPAGGKASGGTSLFNTNNFATVWGDAENAFTLLDINMWENEYWGNSDNATFGQNVANWAAGASNATPSTTTPSSISQASDATGYITFQTTLTDVDDDTSVLKIEYSDDGGSTWYDPDLISVSGDASPTLDDAQTYQIENITSTSDGNALTIVWDTQSATNGNGTLDNTDQDDIKVRVTPNDATIDGTVQTSGAFTVDNLDPSVSLLSPVDGAPDVGTTDNLVITFSENVSVASGDITIKKTSDDALIETIDVTSGQVSVSDNIVTINPAVTLSEQVGYYVQVPATAFDDSFGNSYVGITDTTTWNFTTADDTSPAVSSFSPSNNASDIAIDASLTINFSEAVDIESGNIVIYTASGNVFETIDVTSAKVTGTGTASITVNPANNFTKSNSYYILIDATAFDDASSNSYAGITSTGTWTFATVRNGSAKPVESSDADPLPDPVTNATSQPAENGASSSSPEQPPIELAPAQEFNLRVKAPDSDQVKQVIITIDGKKYPLSLELFDGANPTFTKNISLTKPGTYPYLITVDYGITNRHLRGQFIVKNTNQADQPLGPMPIATTAGAPGYRQYPPAERSQIEIPQVNLDIPDAQPRNSAENFNLPNIPSNPSLVRKPSSANIFWSDLTSSFARLPNLISNIFKPVGNRVVDISNGIGHGISSSTSSLTAKLATLDDLFAPKPNHVYDTVTIKLASAYGTPLSGAEVTLHSTPKTSVTDTEGVATFNAVEAGKHKLVIKYDGYTSKRSLELNQAVAEITINITAEFKQDSKWFW